MLRDLLWYSYHLKMVQALLTQDCPVKMDFCQCYLQKVEDNLQFYSQISFLLLKPLFFQKLDTKFSSFCVR